MRVQNVLVRCILLFTLTLVACSSNTAMPTIEPLEQVMPTATIRATLTPLPTRTPQPTTTATQTETPEPTFTATATPDINLMNVELIGLAWMSNYNMLLSFQFPEEVEPSAYRVTLENKEYSCEKLSTHADRLYCHGPGAKVLAVAWVRIYADGSNQPGFEKRVWIPYFNNNYNTFAP